MPRGLVTRFVPWLVPRAVGLEALYNSRWLAGLLPGLAGRSGLALTLIGIRALVCATGVIAAWLLMRGDVSGRLFARLAIAVSALLLPFEIGWRLTPTNLDPTFGWWVVVAYWMYAGGVIWWLRNET